MLTILMIVAAITALCLLGGLALKWKSPTDPNMCAANSWSTATEGVHENSMEYKADAAIGRYILVKQGTDLNHCDVAAAADKIIGITDDESEAAEDTLTVLILGGGRTYLLTASETITAGQSVFAAASGKAAVTSGTQFIGIAKTGAASGGVCEVIAGKPSSQCRTLSFPINLASITGSQDVVSNFVMPTGGIIRNFKFVVNVPVTTGSKLASLNAEIGTTNLTGGVVALTSATCTPMGAIVEDTLVTAGNVFATGDNFSIEAASVTAFAEGSGTLFMEYTELA